MNFIQVLDWTPVPCDGLGIANIPGQLAFIISMIIKLIQFAVPVLLIIFGMLDLGKAVIASKEDEIKKGQQMFIKRIIAAVLVFFVVLAVKLVVNIFAANSKADLGSDNSISQCIQAIVDYKG